MDGNALLYEEDYKNGKLLRDEYGVYYDLDRTILKGCGNKDLKSYNIENGTKRILGRAFKECVQLTKIDIPESVEEILSGAFCFTALTNIYIPASVTHIEPGAFSDCGKLIKITVDESNTRYDSRDNCNAIIDKQENILLSGCVNTVIPQSVTAIAAGAFCGCSGLTNIVIPDSITKIGEDAFSFCDNLKSITIPNSVSEINYLTFYHCNSLEEIIIPRGSKEKFTRLLYNKYVSCRPPLTDMLKEK